MRLLAILFALTFLFITNTAQAESFTGCLKQDGIIENVAIGTDPLKPCKGKALQISWNSEGPQGDQGPPGPPGVDTLGDLICEDGDVAAFDSGQGAWVCEPFVPDRFVDNGDGTVTDNDTGLMWEMKELCNREVDFSNPHCIANVYNWNSGPLTSPPPFASPDGTLYTSFLAALNLNTTDDPNATCFANYCDWRIPNVVELQSIILQPCSPTGVACVDPIFGPTTVQPYWSSTTYATDISNAWVVRFGVGDTDALIKAFFPGAARAVRYAR